MKLTSDQILFQRSQATHDQWVAVERDRMNVMRDNYHAARLQYIDALRRHAPEWWVERLKQRYIVLQHRYQSMYGEWVMDLNIGGMSPRDFQRLPTFDEGGRLCVVR